MSELELQAKIKEYEGYFSEIAKAINRKLGTKSATKDNYSMYDELIDNIYTDTRDFEISKYMK